MTVADGFGADFDPSRSAAGGRNPWLVAIVVSIATFMQVLDTSIANVALSHIAGGLAASAEEATWVITSYLVASAVILPISGWLSGVIGRKRFYMLCVAVFAASSLLCGLASSIRTLIFFRVVQGLGGGGMAPSEQAILADSFAPAQRSQAFALYGIAVIVAPTVGPTLGGWITDNWSWHWIFFINLPIGIVSLLLVQFMVVEGEALQRERRNRLRSGLKVDWLGFVLVALWLGCLEIVLDKGQESDWFASEFIRSFAAISALALLVLIPWELSHPDPIFDVRMFLRRQFGTSCLVMLVVGAILFSSIQIMPAMMQASFGYTATVAGTVLMPGGVAMLLLMPISGLITNLIAPKYLIAMAMLVVALGVWHMTTLSPQADFGFFTWARIYQTVGLPFLFIPITTASYGDVPPQKTSEAASLINVARNLGGSIGVSLSTTLFAQRQQFHQARLIEAIYPSSIQYLDTLKELTPYFTAQGFSEVDARHRAIAWIGQQVANQAALLSYIDVFWALGALALLMIPVVLLLLRGPRPQRRAVPR